MKTDYWVSCIWCHCHLFYFDKMTTFTTIKILQITHYGMVLRKTSCMLCCLIMLQQRLSPKLGEYMNIEPKQCVCPVKICLSTHCDSFLLALINSVQILDHEPCVFVSCSGSNRWQYILRLNKSSRWTEAAGCLYFCCYSLTKSAFMTHRDILGSYRSLQHLQY